MKIEAAEARLSAALGLSRLGRPRVSLSDRSPSSEVANGVGMLAAATLGTCVALLSLRPRRE
jgi:hypothetical protein